MTREEAITVLKGLCDNPLFGDVHKAAFNIAIHDIKAYHKWNLNELVLTQKDNEQEPILDKINKEVLEALEQEDVTWIVGNDNVQIAVRNMPVDMMQKINAIIGNLQEPTTKNDLGVDAVSRQEVLYLIADDDLSMGQVVRGIHALPSITLQEPKTGKWISTETKGVRYAFWCRYKCPLCGGLSAHTNFCPNCGAKMESEDKE